MLLELQNRADVHAMTRFVFCVLSLFDDAATWSLQMYGEKKVW
jgi:hypothetical protein